MTTLESEQGISVEIDEGGAEREGNRCSRPLFLRVSEVPPHRSTRRNRQLTALKGLGLPSTISPKEKRSAYNKSSVENALGQQVPHLSRTI
jgi:hypothetical protein